MVAWVSQADGVRGVRLPPWDTSGEKGGRPDTERGPSVGDRRFPLVDVGDGGTQGSLEDSS